MEVSLSPSPTSKLSIYMVLRYLQIHILVELSRIRTVQLAAFSEEPNLKRARSLPVSGPNKRDL